jgi:hypothetical protein
MTFSPNPKAVAAEVAKLKAKQPGGGYLTPDDRRGEAHRRKWAEAPLVGSFAPSNAFLFWEAVERALD